MNSNTTGVGNSSLGFRALQLNTTGSSNTALGQQALYSNTTASNNTAVGHQALYANTTGTQNTAVGYVALEANTTGSQNTVMGYLAGSASTTTSRNVYIGQEAGELSTGTLITAVGNQAAEGLSGNTNAGSYGTFIGAYAGQEINTGQLNTFIGYSAGKEVTSGSKNTILGAYDGNGGGLDIRTASNHIVLSDGDGNPRGTFDSSGNFTVGVVNNSAADLNLLVTTPYDGKLVWKDQTGSEVGRIYTSGIPILQVRCNASGGVQLTGGATSWAAVSDEALKENISDLGPVLDKVTSYRCVNYSLKATESSDADKIGFIAQDWEQDFPNVVNTDEDGLLSMKYTETIPVLLKAIQELKTELDAAKAEIEALKGA